MSDKHRHRRSGNSLGNGAISTVTEVHGHPEPVHQPNGINATLGKTPIRGFQASVAKLPPTVVCELHDTHPELTEEADSLGFLLQEYRLLKAQQDSKLVFALASSQIGIATYDQKCVGFVFDQLLYAPQGIECLIKVTGGDGEIDGCNAGLAYRSEGVNGRARATLHKCATTQKNMRGMCVFT